jgi:subfamily B ATP-binding cassette protein MsbA
VTEASDLGPRDAVAPGSKKPLDPQLGRLILRLVGYIRPYLALMALILALGSAHSMSQYTRVYLIKPLIDDVLTPVSGDLRETAADELAAANSQRGSTIEDEPNTGQRFRSAPHRDERLQALLLLTLIAAGMITVVPILSYLRGYYARKLLAFVSTDMRREVAAKLLALPVSLHERTKGGDTLSRIMNDVTRSEGGLAVLLGTLLLNSITTAVGVTAMLVISWQLTFAAAVTIPVVVGVLGAFSGRIRRRALKRQEQVAAVTRSVLGILGGIKVIRAFHGEQREASVFNRRAEDLFRGIMNAAKPALQSRSLLEFITTGAGAGILLLATYFVLRGNSNLTVGTLVVFTAMLATTYRPIRASSNAWTMLVDDLASAQRVFEVLDQSEETPDPTGAETLASIEHAVRFDRVSFSYGRETVLHEVTFEIKAGDVVAIVGPTGSGKTTLVDLLLRFQEPDRGEITFDGLPAAGIARQSLLNLISVVPQDPFLFDASIGDNIRYGRPAATVEEVESAVQMAQLSDFISELSLGLDTQVGESGVELSGGQRQRIAIARAILKDTSLLLLDEATSALDARTERAVQEAIGEMRGRRTVVIVAHRLSTIQKASRIVVLDHGRVVQQGTHDELMGREGLYRDFVTLQREQGLQA